MMRKLPEWLGWLGSMRGIRHVAGLLQPEEDQAVSREEGLGVGHLPSADLTGKDGGAEEME